MDDRKHDGPRDHEHGPAGTEWLELEISQVLQGIAERHVRQMAEELIKDAMKARLKERIGAQLEAIGRRAADELADDMVANLEIEAKIRARTEARRGARGEQPPGEEAGEGWDPRKMSDE
jgi:hypothetical protein